LPQRTFASLHSQAGLATTAAKTSRILTSFSSQASLPTVVKPATAVSGVSLVMLATAEKAWYASTAKPSTPGAALKPTNLSS